MRAIPSRRHIIMATVAMAGGAIWPARNGRAEQRLDGETMPYQAFEALPRRTLDLGGARIEIAFGPGELALSQLEMLAWIERSAKAVALYYGRFPTKTLKLLVLPVDGRGVPYGQAWGDPAAIRIRVGTHAGVAALKADWVMVHEMVHLAFPRLKQRHNWLSEGLAVYVESIARIHTGDLTEAFVWREFRERMPRGLPQSGDQGLDNTPTWGRTYWGGAIFCLLADVEMRKRTGNTRGLQHALRSVNVVVDHNSLWPIEKALQTADAAVGGHVLMELYARMKDKPVTPDLEMLWRDLGVVDGNGGFGLSSGAPHADVRAAIGSPA